MDTVMKLEEQHTCINCDGGGMLVLVNGEAYRTNDNKIPFGDRTYVSCATCGGLGYIVTKRYCKVSNGTIIA